MENENSPPTTPTPSITPEPTKMEEFAKTSTAAKMSGKFNSTSGFFKRVYGTLIEDVDLTKSGQNQEILGKVHSLVGSVRGIKENLIKKADEVKADGKIILRKHAEKLLDQASEFIKDIKKLLP